MPDTPTTADATAERGPCISCGHPRHRHHPFHGIAPRICIDCYDDPNRDEYSHTYQGTTSAQADTPTPLTDQQLAAIRTRHEQTTHPAWRSDTDLGRVLAEVDRLRAEQAQHRDQVLAEAAELLQANRAAVYEDAGRHAADGMDRARDLLLAARTSKEG
ncbi:hypothetical protein OG455_41730 [Kitasatospora sp. NBC_01287]|uniref:hypothetical protein n=1 Tax=Kitasatospora sp. NBC_01287 TaxID=2903573 RepID=UPI00225C0DE4|nr:hypothetical protein [Kitasatospora sp. NBC_01287]MCX4751743.1 hypothetical protein [Kitasatospora sp. NBC_01287]MCX4751965.1 hypothetical protein [Kitasatospora sp. NBC_01287]